MRIIPTIIGLGQHPNTRVQLRRSMINPYFAFAKSVAAIKPEPQGQTRTPLKKVNYRINQRIYNFAQNTGQSNLYLLHSICRRVNKML